MTELPKQLRAEYRDLCMLRDTLAGTPMRGIAHLWGCTVRTANKHVKAMASEMMREVFVNVQGDPEHPAQTRWTVEDFTQDPRGCLVAMTRTQIERLEQSYPALIRRAEKGARIQNADGSETPMAKLIEPDGTRGITVTQSYAIDYCAKHPGWTWEQLSTWNDH